MRNIYSVGQVNTYIKNMFTQDFCLNRIYVKGEVSNCKYHTSGHIYFSLKDETGNISCVMFAGNRKGLAFRMANGQSVIALGSVNVYERDGKYQLYAKEIILDGAGLLYEKFQALKEELEEMGMFAPEYKQPIKQYIQTLGIVTAPTGAAIRDIMNISYRRNPYIQLLLFPAQVQGEGAAQSIVKGIQTLEKAGAETIIVGRGGGSIEDLWAFNEEIVARAIFDCSVPVISAVGHETDFTIADYVADLRAPTPSAAAELAVADIASMMDQITRYEYQLKWLMRNQLEGKRQKFEILQNKLQYLSPENQIREKRLQLIDKEEKLQFLMQNVMKNKKHQLMIYIERMKGVSPLDKLSQGYSYVAEQSGKTLTSITQVDKGDSIQVFVTDGCVTADVTCVRKIDYEEVIS